ncbi:Hsp20/alpha crystallin family protein [Marinobacter nanhaiticus D15-8W]|uniref:Hsp20/alpha crystallin family protein n=1 Tax=Marinobacter nanhaiticus D15-8W TaxID=626887 RepID=N6WW84_9GAMM|nr:Hsp20/alpha crystallin family protein [Marinobacter nanhaiticus]ENO15292.1 Hsp20/alpha crystallin family protein [Marinobacter nanhaiticus D15-8W]BES69005.1 Hsp20/alpha crystallin family protein [Marinobacter nanhaiticus D15-8W]
MSNLTRWNPINEFEDLLERYNRHFGLPSTRSGNENRDLFRRSDWAPAVDIRETAEAFEIHAELPGIQKEDVKVTVHDGVLTLQGERKKQEESGDEKNHRVERVYGSFMRRFTLPDNVSENDINAAFKDGVLVLTLKKVEPAQPRSIEVEVH